jgi:hypothetical protein
MSKRRFELGGKKAASRRETRSSDSGEPSVDWRSEDEKAFFARNTAPVGELVEIPQRFVEKYGGPKARPVVDFGFLECPIEDCPYMEVKAVKLEGGIVVADCPWHRVTYSKIESGDDSKVYLGYTQSSVHPESLCANLYGTLGDKMCWVLGDIGASTPHFRFDSREVPSRLSNDTICLLYHRGLALGMVRSVAELSEERFTTACQTAWRALRDRGENA